MKRVAVLARHRDVAHDHVWAAPRSTAASASRTVATAVDLGRAALEHGGDRLARVGLVVDHQHAQPVQVGQRCRRSRRRHGAARGVVRRRRQAAPRAAAGAR